MFPINKNNKKKKINENKETFEIEGFSDNINNVAYSKNNIDEVINKNVKALI